MLNVAAPVNDCSGTGTVRDRGVVPAAHLGAGAALRSGHGPHGRHAQVTTPSAKRTDARSPVPAHSDFGTPAPACGDFSMPFLMCDDFGSHCCVTISERLLLRPARSGRHTQRAARPRHYLRHAATSGRLSWRAPRLGRLRRLSQMENLSSSIQITQLLLFDDYKTLVRDQRSSIGRSAAAPRSACSWSS